MKSNKFLFGLMVAGLGFAGLTQSCVSDEPFSSGDGEGLLRMQLVVNSNLTRADINEDALKENCTVYISNPNGLLYKYSSANELPNDLPLKFGSYVAEAWTGDSVPASFDKRFYRGYQPFEIKNSGNTTVLLECKIANVAVSIDRENLPAEMPDDWKVTVSNSSATGTLDFTSATEADAKGYFMMPKADFAKDENGAYLKDKDGWQLYTNLKYTVTGTAPDGTPFTKSGLIGGDNGYGENVVEHAHEYVLSFKYNPDYESQGGALIEIEINDEEIEVPVTVGLYSRPAIKGVNFNIEKQVAGESGNFPETMVKVAGFKELKSVQLTYSPEDAEALGLPVGGFDLKTLAPDMEEYIKSLGITWEINPPVNEDRPSVGYITFSSAYLSDLAERNDEYDIKIFVRDGYERTNEATLRLAVGKGAVKEEDPVKVNVISDYLAIKTTSAVITGEVVKDDLTDARVVYRKVGAVEWQNVPVTVSSGNFEVKLTGLDKKTQYDYAVQTGQFISPIYQFTTEDEFLIPFGNMEIWSAANGKNAIQFPGDSYDEGAQFWDSGNHGSATLSATLTQGSSVMAKSGSMSAELKSQFVGVSFLPGAGKFAAGNLFMGRFGETIGMSGAYLTFGKPYNGSHPEKLSVWVSYTPGEVDYKDSKCPYTFASKELDHGQIYVALATEPIKVNTGDSNAKDGFPAKVFMDYDNDKRILGFGEKTWKGETFGGSQLQNLEIPITWREGAHNQKPTTLIIVCSASKYGDYFTGSSKSIMYVDDFELVY